jgi:carbon storage regulator
MLVLSRKRNERIVVPTLGITIVLVEIRGDKARIGIEAPGAVPVHRAEVWAAIQRESEGGDADPGK